MSLLCNERERFTNVYTVFIFEFIYYFACKSAERQRHAFVKQKPSWFTQVELTFFSQFSFSVLCFFIMSTCAVFGCRSNYKTGSREIRKVETRVSTFALPHDNRRATWIKCLHRKDFIPSKNTRICALHFQPEDFLPDFVLTQPDGSEKSYKRAHPRLKSTAIPSVFPTFQPISPLKFLKLESSVLRGDRGKL